MKSAHRHELETNALAQRLEVFIERVRPYAALAAGVAVAIAVVVLVWSFVAGQTAARHGEAWDAYNRSVAAPLASRPAAEQTLQSLKQAAEEFPGTPMQQLSDVTWADGQVWLATQDYLHNRPAAMEALNRATSAYQSILRTSRDERLVNRARLGLARVYEMQNDLEKAREQYLRVEGAYAEYASLQAERLEQQETQDDYSWLAAAQAPRPRAPFGPGTPGQRPEFTAGDFALPGSGPDGEPIDGPPIDEESFETLLRSFDLGFPAADEADRYDTGETPATDDDAPLPDTDADAD